MIKCVTSSYSPHFIYSLAGLPVHTKISTFLQPCLSQGRPQCPIVMQPCNKLVTSIQVYSENLLEHLRIIIIHKPILYLITLFHFIRLKMVSMYMGIVLAVRYIDELTLPSKLCQILLVIATPSV